jgi:formate-dependent nitrite reductase membrane component NrfD
VSAGAERTPAGLAQDLWRQARERLTTTLTGSGSGRHLEQGHAGQVHGRVTPPPPPAELRSDTGAYDRLARMWDAGGGASVNGTAQANGAADGHGTAHSNGTAVGNGTSRDRKRRRGRRGGDDGSRETPMVPKASFSSYYGRPILKPPVWKDDIAYYFFLGGLAAGCSLLGAGADQTGRPALRRGTRLTALGALGLGSYYLIHDLGRPERFHHMLRVAKPTSPMSMGTWVLALYGPLMGVAAISEVMPAWLRRTLPGRLLEVSARPAGLAAAAIAPAVASYTAVLLSQTAVPAWHESHPELPFIFTASAAASAAGLGMIVAPVHEASPARRFAMFGAIVELAASRRLENRLGLVGETFRTGEAGRDLERASTLTAVGVLGAMLLGRRSRSAAVLSGAALLAGGFFERLGLLRAGIASTKDPKYVVTPQLERKAAREAAAAGGTDGTTH